MEAAGAVLRASLQQKERSAEIEIERHEIGLDRQLFREEQDLRFRLKVRSPCVGAQRAGIQLTSLPRAGAGRRRTMRRSCSLAPCSSTGAASRTSATAWRCERSNATCSCACPSS